MLKKNMKLSLVGIAWMILTQSGFAYGQTPKTHLSPSLQRWIGFLQQSERVQSLRTQQQQQRRIYQQAAEIWFSDEPNLSVGAGPRISEAGNLDADISINLTQEIYLSNEQEARGHVLQQELVQKSSENDAIIRQWMANVLRAQRQICLSQQRQQQYDAQLTVLSTVKDAITARLAQKYETPPALIVLDHEISKVSYEKSRREQEEKQAYQVLDQYFPSFTNTTASVPTIANEVCKNLEERQELFVEQIPSEVFGNVQENLQKNADNALQEANAHKKYADTRKSPPLDLGISLVREGGVGSPANYIGLINVGTQLPIFGQQERESQKADVYYQEKVQQQKITQQEAALYVDQSKNTYKADWLYWQNLQKQVEKSQEIQKISIERLRAGVISLEEWLITQGQIWEIQQHHDEIQQKLLEDLYNLEIFYDATSL